MKTGIIKIAKEYEQDAIEIRRCLHQNPEVGFELLETLKLVTEKLKSYGCEPRIAGKAGVAVDIGQGSRTFLLRADMDALPIRENTDLPFASNNGNMHACGHDFHTSSLLLAAKILKEKESELKGTVRLMFQPCEEGMEGAVDMLDAGILENPVPDGALALHVLHGSAGKIGYSPGIACASSDIFTVEIKGKGGHGAAPHLVIDPINVAVHVHMALQAINSRETNPNDMVVCTVCQIGAGTAPNIFPDTAIMSGTIRTIDNDVRERVKKRFIEIAENTAKAFGAKANVTFKNAGVPPMINESELLSEVTSTIDEMFGEEVCYEIPRMTGSEDFSVVSQKIPSVLLWFGTGAEEEGYPYGVHDARVTFNEDMIHKMAATYAQTAISFLVSRQ